MIAIRLSRRGTPNKPFYRIVAVNKRSKRDGKVLDNLGWWQPAKNELKINKEKLQKWIAEGAQLSDKVRSLIQQK